MRRSIVLALAVAALAAVAGASAAGSRLAVLGFQSDYSPPRLIDKSAAALTLVGVDGVDLSGAGHVSAPTSADLRQVARAHAHELPAVLLVSNWSNSVNDFSEPLAYRTLGSPTAIASATSALAAAVAQDGWDGISVDLESLAPRDRAGLSSFVSDLHADLSAVDSLTVCVTAYTSLGAYAANGYDLQALDQSASQIVLMTYDDHGPWENTPGPIGPLRWQKASVAALERVVPRDKIFLGAADYGYGWRPHANVNLTVAQARKLARTRARWNAAAGEWTAKLPDGSTLWWSDKRSLKLRLALARRLGVYGVAIWSLGSGDPIP